MKKSLQGTAWLVITLLVTLSMLLAACGTPAVQTVIVKETVPVTVKETVQVQVTQVVPKNVEVTSTPAPSTGRVYNKNVSGTVEMWHFWASPVRRNAIRRVISICQQILPNIKVNDTVKPFGDIWTANIAAVAAGSGMPDVIVEDRPQLVQRAADQIDTDLSDYAQRDGIDGSAFWPFTWKEATVEGKPYGIPFETDVRVLYWNKQA